MPEPVNPPVENPPAKEFAAISDLLGKLNESVSNLDERLTGFEETLSTVTTPPVENPPAEQPKWKPETWDEFPALAEQKAQEVFERKEKERMDAEVAKVQESKNLQAQIDKDFDDQLTKLEKEGTIPPVEKAGDPNDAGVQTRKELFALGIKYGSPNLVEMANLRKDLLAAGYSFDTKEGKLIKSNPSPFGAGAPVGSSSKTSFTKSGPSYKEIHGQTMDQMVQRYNS